MFVGSKYQEVREGGFLGWKFLEVKERSISFKTKRNREESDGSKYSVTSYSYILHCIAQETLGGQGEYVQILEEELDSQIMGGFYDLLGYAAIERSLILKEKEK